MGPFPFYWIASSSLAKIGFVPSLSVICYAMFSLLEGLFPVFKKENREVYLLDRVSRLGTGRRGGRGKLWLVYNVHKE